MGPLEKLPAWLRGPRRGLDATLPFIAGAVLCGVVLALHARSFSPFMADDAFISLRYADRLLAGDGLTWTDHERVEGYSNLLWVLLVAGLSGLSSLELVTAARLLGLAGVLAAVAALLAPGLLEPTRRLPARIAGALALVASPPIAVWAIGGLEQALVAGLLALALAAAHRVCARSQPRTRDWVLTGLPLGLLCLTRPDGPVLVAGVAAGLCLARGLSRASLGLAARVCLIPLGFTLAQLAFRRLYYDDWLPNTAYAKLSFTLTRLRDGLRYLGDGARALPLLPLAGLGGVLLLFTPARRPAALLLPTFFLWAAYVATIGGDIFPAFRHLVPLLVVAAFLVVTALELVFRRVPGRAAAATVMVALGILAFVPGQRHPEIKLAREERWEWEAEPVGRLLARAFERQRPLLAADAAGCLPFFSRLPALDMLGLNDRFLARNPPPDFGHGHLGHELGNGRYLLSREPDLVVFCGPLGSPTACFRGGKEMEADPAFKQQYRLARLSTQPFAAYEAQVWVRIQGRLGLEARPDDLRVPGLMLGSRRPLLSQLGADGELRTTITDREFGLTPALPLAPGTWTVTARTSPAARLKARGPTGAELTEAGATLTLELQHPTAVTIEVVAPEGQRVEVSEVELRRSPG